MNLKSLNELLKHELAVLLGGSAVIFGLRLAGAGLTFLTQLLLLKWMGAAELGRFVFVFSLATVLAWVSTLGVSSASMRFVPQAIAQGRLGVAAGFFRATAAIAAISSTIIALIAAGLVAIFTWNAPGDECLTLLLGMMLVPFLAAFTAQNDCGRAIYLFMTIFLPSMLLRHVLFLGGVAALYFLGVKLNAAWAMGVLLTSVAILTASQLFFIGRAARKAIGPAKPEYHTREWIMTGLPLVVAYGFTGFFLEINIAIAGAFLSRADLAVYNLTFQITNLIAFFLVAVGVQFGPHASRLLGEGKLDALQAMVSRTAQVRLAFAVAMFVGFALAGGLILSLFKFENGYVALLILASTQVVGGLVGPVATLQNIFGLQRWAFAISGISVVVNLVLTPILATEFGIEGAAFAAFATMTVWNVLTFIAIIRFTEIEPSVLHLRGVFGRRGKPASGLKPKGAPATPVSNQTNPQS